MREGEKGSEISCEGGSQARERRSQTARRRRERVVSGMRGTEVNVVEV